ncbi:MAG: choice-of-anchor D domain-containing protein [Myxococcota bacterium]|nr:choice-of-anchor D domain-containing protein [Myxococcota bacterium]
MQLIKQRERVSSSRRLTARLMVLGILSASAVANLACDDADLTVLSSAGAFEPETIEFGEVTIGRSSNRSAALKNIGSTVLAIDRIEVTDPFAIAENKASIENALIPVGESLDITVTFLATVEGPQESTIIAYSGDSKIPLVVKATGVVAQVAELTLSPASLDYGVVAIGSSEIGQVTFTNTGLAPGIIENPISASTGMPVAAGDEYFSNAVFPLEVPAQGSITAEIVFAPKAAGPRPDQFRFPTSNGPELTLGLAGEGLIPQGSLACSPSSVNFGPIERGMSGTQMLGCTAMGGPVRLVSGQITAGGPDFSLTAPVTTIDISAGSSVALEVAYTAAGAPRVVNGTLRLNYNGSTGVTNLDIPLTAEVVPPPPTATAISLILRWDTAMTDIDLHLVRPGGTPFDVSGDDCYYANKNPDWNILNDNTDDPFLDVDDIDGNGPEEINLQSTAPGRYEVYVHYFNDRFSGPSTASVDIFIAGQMVSSVSQSIICNDLWHVGTIDWDGAAGNFIPNGTTNRSSEGICF